MQQGGSGTAIVPSTAVISWEPNQIEIQCEPGSVVAYLETNKNILDFIPGKFQMIIKQYPRVKIEFIGEQSHAHSGEKTKAKGKSV